MNKVNIGILGLGRMGKTHAYNLKNLIPNANLIALCSVDDQAKKLSKEWNIPYWYNDYQAMLDNEKIEAVVIVSPTNLHPLHIKMALDAKKHVFCEKPLGTDLQECADLVNYVEQQKNLVVQIGFMRRFDQEYLAAKQMVEKNKIGKPILARMFAQDPEKDVANMFSFGPSSGGQFVDVCAHDIDLMIWYLQSYPRKVYALGQAYKYKEFENWNDGDVVAAMIEFENKAIGILMASRIGSAGYQAQGELIGTHGHIYISSPTNNQNQVSLMDYDGSHTYFHQNFNERFANAYVNELTYFINRILNKDYDNSAIKDALINIYAALGCKQAFETKKEVIIKYWFDKK